MVILCSGESGDRAVADRIGSERGHGSPAGGPSIRCGRPPAPAPAEDHIARSPCAIDRNTDALSSTDRREHIPRPVAIGRKIGMFVTSDSGAWAATNLSSSSAHPEQVLLAPRAVCQPGHHHDSSCQGRTSPAHPDGDSVAMIRERAATSSSMPMSRRWSSRTWIGSAVRRLWSDSSQTGRFLAERRRARRTLSVGDQGLSQVAVSLFRPRFRHDHRHTVADSLFDIRRAHRVEEGDDRDHGQIGYSVADQHLVNEFRAVQSRHAQIRDQDIEWFGCQEVERGIPARRGLDIPLYPILRIGTVGRATSRRARWGHHRRTGFSLWWSRTKFTRL